MPSKRKAAQIEEEEEEEEEEQSTVDSESDDDNDENSSDNNSDNDSDDESDDGDNESDSNNDNDSDNGSEEDDDDDNDSNDDENSDDENDDNDDESVGKKRKRSSKAKPQAKSTGKAKKTTTKAKAKPKATKAKAKAKAKAKSKTTTKKSSKKVSKSKAKASSSTTLKKSTSSDRNSVKSESVKIPKLKTMRKFERLEEARKAYKWWEAPTLPDGVNWRQLQHAGVIFTPPYIRHNVSLLYDGKPVHLTDEQEEIATFYASMPNDGPQLGNPKTRGIFQKNFFEDFKESLGPGHVIKEFNKCDFSLIASHLEMQKTLRKAATEDEKMTKKLEKEVLQLTYGYCLIDGRMEKVSIYILYIKSQEK